MNGYLWTIYYVEPDDSALNDIFGQRTVATTDWETCTIYLSKNLSGPFKTRVLLHELGHCVMFSFGLIEEIHHMVYPEYWIEAEEWVCNFIADYGKTIFNIAYQVLGDRTWNYIPRELEKMVA